MEIKTTPVGRASVNNEMLFIVWDPKVIDPVTYPDYKYVADVYVGSDLVARLKSPPHPTNSLGVFDVSRVLQSYVSHQFQIETDKEDYTVRLAYQVKFGEEYNGTTYLNILTDSERYAFETYKTPPYDSTGQIISDGLASNMPTTRTAVNNNEALAGLIDHFLIPVFSNVTGVTNLTATYKDKNGNTLSTNVFDNSDFTANTIRQYNVTNNNDQVAQILITGPITMTINVKCSRYPVRTIVWLNPFGAYDSQHFGMVSMKQSDIERKSFEKIPYTFNSSGEVSYRTDGGVYYGGKTSYASYIKHRMKLTSELINDDEYEWLKDLFYSPDVYLFITNIGFIPVTILQNNYEHRTYLNSGLKPLEFEVEFGLPFNAQNL